MEPPPTKKSKMDTASSGIIILDPAGAPGKKVSDNKITQALLKIVPPANQYKLPTARKDDVLKASQSGAPASQSVVPKLSLTSDITKSSQPNTDKAIPLPKQSSQLAKPVPTGGGSLLKQPRQLIKIDTIKPTTNSLLQHPTMPAKLPAQQPLAKVHVTQTNCSTLQNTQNTITSQIILPSKVQTNLKPQAYSKPVNQHSTNGLTQQINSVKLPINQQVSKQLNFPATNYEQQISINLVSKQPAANLLPKPQATAPTPRTKVTPQQRLKPQFQYIEFINEALFDYEEEAKKQVITLSDSEENTTAIEEKTLEYFLKMHKVPSDEFDTKCVQTDQPADDRIYCGFVNVTKYGPDKYFNLRCFYCDEEYPISFYSDFSDHINEKHRDLEKVHVKENYGDLQTFNVENDAANTTKEMEFSDFSDSNDDMPQDPPPTNLFIDLIDTGRKETYNPAMQKKKELLPQDFDDGEESETASESETYFMCVDNYDPSFDHCYSQSYSKPKQRDAEPVDEIIFGKTSHVIVLDFLDHLKGFSCLWRNRDLAPVNYDNELLDFMDIMVDKWGLNLKRRVFRKNLENIKSWYIGMAISKQELGDKFNEHTYIDYYKKCEEYLPVGNTSKQHKIYCDLCDRFCFDKIGLQMHKYRKHKIGQLPYGCSKCDKRFDYVHKLRRHILRFHTYIPLPFRKYDPPKTAPPPEPKFICYECNKEFSNSEELKRHFDIHPKGDCPYVCEECGRRFRTVTLRNSHLKRHKEPTFECTLCPKKFFTGYHLHQHINCHKGDPNYICEWCGKTFIRQKLFKEHIDYVHFGRGYCKICDRHYHKSSILHKHLRNMHRPLIGSVDDLAARRRRRRNVGESGSRKGMGAGPRPQTRKYTYVTDPVTKKRRIACPICDKSYYQYDSLYAHAKRHHGSLPGKIERQAGNQKTPSRKRKRGGKIVGSKPTDMKAEAASAVNSSTVNSVTKLEYNLDLSGVIGPNESNVTVDNSAIESDIKVEKNMTTMSFEKFVDEIAMGSNFVSSSLPNLNDSESKSLREVYEHSPVKLEAATCVKSEEFLAGDYEFMLNGSSVFNF